MNKIYTEILTTYIQHIKYKHTYRLKVANIYKQTKLLKGR